jgi:hypothetical protein
MYNSSSYQFLELLLDVVSYITLYKSNIFIYIFIFCFVSSCIPTLFWLFVFYRIWNTNINLKSYTLTTSKITKTQLPPGTFGLFVFGESFSLIVNQKDFFIEREKKYNSNVFSTSLSSFIYRDENVFELTPKKCVVIISHEDIINIEGELMERLIKNDSANINKDIDDLLNSFLNECIYDSIFSFSDKVSRFVCDSLLKLFLNISSSSLSSSLEISFHNIALSNISYKCRCEHENIIKRGDSIIYLFDLFILIKYSIYVITLVIYSIVDKAQHEKTKFHKEIIKSISYQENEEKEIDYFPEFYLNFIEEIFQIIGKKSSQTSIINKVVDYIFDYIFQSYCSITKRIQVILYEVIAIDDDPLSYDPINFSRSSYEVYKEKRRFLSESSLSWVSIILRDINERNKDNNDNNIDIDEEKENGNQIIKFPLLESYVYEKNIITNKKDDIINNNEDKTEHSEHSWDEYFAPIVTSSKHRTASYLEIYNQSIMVQYNYF